MSANRRLTVHHDEEIDAEDREPLSDLAVGVLKLALHDGCVYLNCDDASQTA